MFSNRDSNKTKIQERYILTINSALDEVLINSDLDTNTKKYLISRAIKLYHLLPKTDNDVHKRIIETFRFCGLKRTW